MVAWGFSFIDRAQIGRWSRHLLLFYLLWLLLSHARADFLLPGIAAAAVAAWSSTLLWQKPGLRFTPQALPNYLLHFLWRSLLGGVDVAARACHPRMPLSLRFLGYRAVADDQTKRVIFADVVTLMPGTLVVRLREREVQFHILAGDGSRGEELQEEERLLDRLLVQGKPHE